METAGDVAPTETPSTPRPKTRNAFSELMAPKQKVSPKMTRQMRSNDPDNLGDPRNGLLPYIKAPEDHARVIRFSDEFVLLRDAFPKAAVHLLLLPRDPSKYVLHAHTALADSAFLERFRKEAHECMLLAASELANACAPYSLQHAQRVKAMDEGAAPADLPPARDFTQEIRMGFHAHPSMNHLHLHIFSRDMYSPALKHRKHYNSFNTDFLLPLDEFPYAEEDDRRSVAYQNANLKQDFVCWRCGKMFGNHFKLLKEHLEQEFLEWRKE
jgi:aprataxin